MLLSWLTTTLGYFGADRCIFDMDICIKAVGEALAEDFGHVIYDGWGETYRGLMPDEILDGRSLERWVDMARKYPDGKRVAYIDGAAAGVIAFLPQTREFASFRDGGEIAALYVLKRFQRHGVGKALLERALKELGGGRVTLFVLKGNENAVGFYRAMGFGLTGHEISDGGLTELEMVRNSDITQIDEDEKRSLS